MKKGSCLFFLFVMILAVCCSAAAQTEVGSTFTMGQYEQDNNPANGPEPIEWVVLASENGQTLVISRFGLDAVRYNEAWTGITWADSSLRSWLNGEFYQNAFSPEEQARIEESEVRNPANSQSGVSGGDDTTDRMFVLSLEEAESCFGSDEDRQSTATAYSKAKGASGNRWWLRSAGGADFQAALVTGDGKIGYLGDFVDADYVMVRPAFRLGTGSSAGAQSSEFDGMSAEDLYNIGYDCYAKEDYENALKYLTPAADMGNVDAQTLLGVMYDYGDGGTQDFEKARYYLELGAAQGDPWAQQFLGEMYQYGRGVEPAPEKAVAYYMMAARQKLPNAQVSLGVMYEYGDGVQQSYETAAYYYQLAADQGYAKGQTYLGDMYELGKGVEQSYEMAVKYYKLSADQGNADGQYYLGTMYEFGEGVGQSYETAASYYELAAAQNHGPAQNRLGILYKNGRGVTQSYDKAVEYFEKAIENGSSGAMVNLGIMYEYGDGVSKSLEDAARLYQMAADNGYAYGQFCIGDMYEYGKGVAKDLEKAIYYYRLAADQGDEDAINRLKELGEY